MHELLDIMARLRDPETGCPWDLGQDFRSIVPYTLEEAYEVADAIECGELRGLRGELGDLLFQIVFYARLAEEAGLFDFQDVVDALRAKLIRRHPHVFGAERVSDAADQNRAWERIKAEERQLQSDEETSELDGVPRAMPALTRAAKLGRRATRVSFDWESAAGPLEKVREELAELEIELDQEDPGASDRRESELGDVLFALTNLARHLGVDPEAALRRTCDKFERRFRYLERELADHGYRPGADRRDEMERLWGAAKRAEQRGSAPGEPERD